ncbi:uncharacterized protein LOC117106610 [Anneissia japonica]|uniref:uncharacterized protein LOC117106610 n=1 Tax=Anneissia japonica TaxID=1529436 RepID=UPI001425B077|nr:uncharacterized protein LOC117106610 [Anneissia japonica]
MLTDEKYANLARKAVANARKELEKSQHEKDSQKPYSYCEIDDNHNELVNNKLKDVTEYYEDVNNMDLSQLIAAELETPLMSDDEDVTSYPKLITYDETHTKNVKTLQSKGKKIKNLLSKSKKGKALNSSVNESSNKFQHDYKQYRQLSDEEMKQDTGKSKTQERKSSKEKLQCMKTVFKERHIPERGVWVQCTQADCKKWRYLADVTDPSTIEELWSCELNSESDFNSCNKPEANWKSVEEQQGFVDTKFTIGSIVWAKLSGYPWWPAMIEEDPNVGEYFWLVDEWRSVPSDYHVVFLDKNITRAWINRSSIRLFLSPEQSPGVVKVKGKLLAQLEDAKQAAMRAKDLPIKERIVEYGFSSHFKGKWGGADSSLAEEFQAEWPGYGKKVDVEQKSENDEPNSKENAVLDSCSQNMEGLESDGVADGNGLEMSSGLLKKEKTRKRRIDKSNHLKIKKSRKEVDTTNSVGSNKTDMGSKPKASHSVFDFDGDVQADVESEGKNNIMKKKRKKQVAESRIENTGKIETGEDIKMHGQTYVENEEKSKKMKKKKKQILEDKTENTGPIGMDEDIKMHTESTRLLETDEDIKMRGQTEVDQSEEKSEKMKEQKKKQILEDRTENTGPIRMDDDIKVHTESTGLIETDEDIKMHGQTDVEGEEKSEKMKKKKKKQILDDKTESTGLIGMDEDIKMHSQTDVESEEKSKKMKKKKKKQILEERSEKVQPIETGENMKMHGQTDMESEGKSKKMKKKKKKQILEEKTENTGPNERDQLKFNTLECKGTDKKSDLKGIKKYAKIQKKLPVQLETRQESVVHNMVTETKEHGIDGSKGKKLKPTFKAPRKKENHSDKCSKKCFKPPTMKDTSNVKPETAHESMLKNDASKCQSSDQQSVQSSDVSLYQKENKSEDFQELDKAVKNSEYQSEMPEVDHKDLSPKSSEVFEFLGRPNMENQVVQSNDNQMDYQQTLASTPDIGSWDHIESTKDAIKHDIDDNDSQPFEIEE